MSIKSDLDYLEETKQLIKEAIIDKGQEISDSDNFRSYVTKIENITTLEEGTADADATANNIEDGKTAYVDGIKITGSLETVEPYNNKEVTSIYINDNNTQVENTMGYSILMKPNSRLLLDNSIIVSALHLTSNVIKEGVSLFGVNGTLEELDTSDANATAPDIIQGKTAYVNGIKISGSLSPYLGSTLTGTSATLQNDGLLVKGNLSSKQYVDTNVDISIKSSISDTATAIGLTADKIKQGVTILGITGTVDPIPTNTTRVTTEGAGYAADSIAENNSYVTVKKSVSNPVLVSSNVNYTYNVTKGDTAQAINLTADKIKQGETILGIQGTHSGGEITQDATATASDIIYGQTAYARNTKLTGTIPVYNGNTNLTKDSIVYNNNELKYYSDLFDSTGYVMKNGRIIMSATDNEIASAINLNSNMIADGTTLFGITGSYVGQGAISQEEYDACEDLADSILGIV